MKVKFVEAMIEERPSGTAWALPGFPDFCPLVPVGTIESIMAQLQRAGFLNCEEVAIVRLSDLRKLIAIAEEREPAHV